MLAAEPQIHDSGDIQFFRNTHGQVVNAPLDNDEDGPPIRRISLGCLSIIRP
jgi:hypothetical protein